MMIAGIVCCIFGALAVLASYSFIVRFPMRLASLDKLDDGFRKKVEQLRDRCGGVRGMRNLGYAMICLALFFFGSGAYLIADQESNGTGIRFGLWMLGIACVVMSAAGLFAMSHPTINITFGSDEDRAEYQKFAWGVGVAGVILVLIARFVR